MSSTPSTPAAHSPLSADESEGRVVVGVDGSPSSVAALRWASTYATAFDCGIDVLAAWAYPNAYGYGGGAEGWRPDEDAAVALDAAVKEAFGDAVPAGLRRLVREGHAARVLVAASHGARLLVLGSRGHGGFTGLLLGSVSTYCAEHAYSPVVIDRMTTGASAA